MLKILQTAVLIYVIYLILLYLVQRWMIFPRYLLESPPQPERALSRLDIQISWIEIAGGQVETWFIPPESRNFPCPVIIMAHGNAELIDYQLTEAELFSSLGLGVLLVEYPGYGRSTGKPGQNSITEAFVKAYDELIKSDQVDASRIVFFGRSLGGGAVCSLAQHRTCAAMILVSTFTSIRTMAKSYLAPPFMIKDPFDNLSLVSTLPMPFLLFHGKHDTVIPFYHAQQLHRAARQGKLITYSCGHNDLPPDFNAYMHEIRLFLLEHGILNNGNAATPDISS